MKRLFTSCYGRSRWFPKGTPQVRASRTAPWWWHPAGSSFEADLVPRPECFAAYEEGRDWLPSYRSWIGELHQTDRLAEILERLPGGAILLCYEADWNECHRKVLADYLNEHGLAHVSEFQRPARQSALQVLFSFVT